MQRISSGKATASLEEASNEIRRHAAYSFHSGKNSQVGLMNPLLNRIRSPGIYSSFRGARKVENTSPSQETFSMSVALELEDCILSARCEFMLLLAHSCVSVSLSPRKMIYGRAIFGKRPFKDESTVADSHSYFHQAKAVKIGNPSTSADPRSIVPIPVDITSFVGTLNRGPNENGKDSWSEPDAGCFKVRGATYLKDRQKVSSGVFLVCNKFADAKKEDLWWKRTSRAGVTYKALGAIYLDDRQIVS